MTLPAGSFMVRTFFHKYHKFFDVCEINGSKFALFNNPLYSNNFSPNVTIDLADYNIILLAPLTAEGSISIEALSVVVLSALNAKKGEIRVTVPGKCIALDGKINGYRNNLIEAGQGFYSVAIPEEPFKMILEGFRKGMTNKNGEIIADALIETFDVIQDPFGENDNPCIDIKEAFEFFNISIEN